MVLMKGLVLNNIMTLLISITILSQNCKLHTMLAKAFMPVNMLQPIQVHERIQLLDVLRGFAILGIFILNLNAFSFYWFLTDAQKAKLVLALYDHKTIFMHSMFFEGKFYSIFLPCLSWVL